MEIETSINADGGGTRHMELIVEDDGEDSTFTLADYRQLMGVTEERGWTHTTRRKKRKNSDEMSTYHTFSHNAKADDLLEMAAMSGDIFIKAANQDPNFGDVYFANDIEVESGMSARGRTIVYRETLYWAGLMEALLDYRLLAYRPSLEKIYPELEPAQIDCWFAFFKGTFMAAVDDGMIGMGKGDRARRFAGSIERVVAYAAKAIRAGNAGADVSFITHMTWNIFAEWDEFDKTAEEMDLMGVVLATSLDLTVRVDIPGRVVETNADRREVYADPSTGRQKLVWEIETEESLSRPIEIYVKTEVPR